MAVLTWAGFLLCHNMRQNLNIAIVAMVNASEYKPNRGSVFIMYALIYVFFTQLQSKATETSLTERSASKMMLSKWNR